MDTTSNSNWNLLPPRNLQQVFKNLHIYDVEKCLQVCWHWYNEANFYLKDKYWFSISKIRNLEDFQGSKRSFQFLMILQQREEFDSSLIKQVLQCVSQRRTSYPILKTFIKYNDYPTLSRILQHLLGKHVKSLTLEKADKNRCYRRPKELFYSGLFSEFDHLDYGCLTSVENLSIRNLDNSLLNISRSFGSLRSLKLNTKFSPYLENISEKLLRHFIDCNPLTTLDLEEASLVLVSATRKWRFDVNSLMAFENVRNLKALHLNRICNDNDVQILSKHLNHLKTIRVVNIDGRLFTPSHLNQLFQISNLYFKGSIRVLGASSNIDGIFCQHWTYSRNFKVTHLDLSFRCVSEDSLRVFLKSFPNMKVFVSGFISPEPSFSLFLDMSKTWIELESLEVQFSRLLPSITKEILHFKNLLDLTVCSLIDEHFYGYLKAEKLKNVILRFRYIFTETLENHTMRKIFRHLSENSAKIEILEINGRFDNQTIDFLLSENFLNLKELIFNWHPMDNEVRGVTLSNTLERVLSAKKDNIKKVVLNLPFYLDNSELRSFSEGNGGAKDFKNNKLRRMFIQNKEIFIISYFK